MLSAGRLTSFFKKWWLPLLFCVVLPTAVVGSVIQRHSQFSPIDEQAHFDYVERLYSHGVPVLGDRLLPSTLKEIACRGTALPGIVTPPCDSATFTAKDFPGEGYQYQAQQPPLYYAITAPIAKVVEKMVGLGPVGSARVIGVLSLIAGLLLSWHVAMMMKISRLTSLAGIAVMGLSPTVVYYSSIVTNDSAAILCGALVCYVAARTHIEQKSFVRHAVVAGIICAFVKSVCALPALVLGGLYIALSIQRAGGIAVMKTKQSRQLWWRSQTAQTYGRTGVGFVAAVTASSFIWALYMRFSAGVSPLDLPTFQVLRARPTNLGVILSEATNMLYPLTGLYNPFQFWNQDVYNLLNSVGAFTLVAGCAAGMVISKRTWWSIAGPVALGGAYICGIGIAVTGWWVYRIGPDVVSRYALSLLPLLVLIVCAGIQRATAQKVFALGAFAFSAMSVWMIIQTPLV